LRLNAIYTARQYLRDAGVVRFVRPPRALLNGKPVWQLLHEAGVNSAVVRLPFTYPPTGQADIVVSDWVGNDSWEEMGVQHRATIDAVTPPNLASQILAPFQPGAGDPHLFDRIVPERSPRRPADAVVDPFEYLRASADADERMFDVSTFVLKRNPKQPFLALYIGGLDSAEHAFWQYQFPEDYGSNSPAAEDVKRFGTVIERYVKFIDDRMNALRALYQQEPNIVIVSDHGHGASQIPVGWRGWHTKDGIFLAAGPSVHHVKERIAVSYYDIVPTLVSLKGFDKPAGLGGKVLVDVRTTTSISATR
jgi:predicted AlkP superfamily phosphohydrolase/phosphomutase